MRNGNYTISIVVPAYNEEQNIPILYKALVAVLKNYQHYEIIFVDDGSKDATLQQVKTIASHDKNVHYLSFSRNFGQQSALKAGFDFSSGDCVVSLDADMQHPPAMISLLIDKWLEGYDVVYTERLATKGISFLRKATSKIFYLLMNMLGDLKLDHGTADFRLLDRRVVACLKKFKEQDLYYKALLPWLGFKQVKIPYQAQERFWGTTKWSFFGLCKLAVLGITSFSIRPLIAPFFLGFLLCMVGGVLGFYAMYVKLFTGYVLPLWLPLLSVLLFIGGLQFCCLGIFGVYLGQMHNQVKERPLYLVEESSFGEGETCSK